jgi:transcriptional regulator with XRE-family HTH domain
MNFPPRLRSARLRCELTVDALAERACVDPRTFRYWETGAYAPLRSTLAKVEAVVGAVGRKPPGGPE